MYSASSSSDISCNCLESGVTIDEISEIRDRWLSVVGENLKHFQADPQDLSERGRLLAIDIPRLLEAARHNVLDHRLDASNACGQSGGSDGSA